MAAFGLHRPVVLPGRAGRGGERFLFPMALKSCRLPSTRMPPSSPPSLTVAGSGPLGHGGEYLRSGLGHLQTRYVFWNQCPAGSPASKNI